MKSQLKSATKLAIIKECQEFLPLSETTNRFASGSIGKFPPASKDDQHSLYDSAFLARSVQDILKDYESNPFFKAKLNYILKSRNTTPTPSHHQKRIAEHHLQTFRNSNTTFNQELELKLQEIALKLKEKGKKI